MKITKQFLCSSDWKASRSQEDIMAGSDRRSQKEKMLAGEWYRAIGPEITADHRRAQMLLHAYNSSLPDEVDRRAAILQDLIGRMGEDAVIRPPFQCDYGYNISLGRGVFLNFGCVFLDIISIEVGDLCQIGSMVQVLAADHPRDPALQKQGYERGVPVRIGQNVWIGSGAIILPGVSIGDNAIVGAGSVVTRDVPPGATVVGNAARI
jgi:maltose O-acetyltransferase